MLADKIRDLTAQGFAITFYEATGRDECIAKDPFQLPYLTVEVGRLGRQEAFGADFKSAEPGDAEICQELDLLLELHRQTATRTTDKTSSAA